MLFSKFLPSLTTSRILQYSNTSVCRSTIIGYLEINKVQYIDIKGITFYTHARGLTALPWQKSILEPNIPTIIASRNVDFFNRSNAESLWKAATSVSNAGKKKGRGKSRIRPRNLNKGQYIGMGEENMVWPGLNAPIVWDKEINRQKKLPKDEDRMKKLAEIRDKMGKFRRYRITPLERGWTSAKMGGRSAGSPASIGENNFEGFDSIILEGKIVKLMTEKGQRRRFSSFIITGNKDGLAGFGLAKANTMDGAINMSKSKAAQRLLYIERGDGHTVLHDFFTQYMYTRIFVKRKPEGYGLRCHRVIKEICKLLGIKNIHAKVEGAMNYQNITKAFFAGLLKQKTFQQMADEKGLHVVQLRPGTLPKVLASPSNGVVRTKDEISMDEDLDFTTYCLGDRVEVERKKFIPFYTRFRSYNRHLKTVLKTRNHEKIKHQQILEYGAVKSFLTEKYEECEGDFLTNIRKWERIMSKNIK